MAERCKATIEATLHDLDAEMECLRSAFREYAMRAPTTKAMILIAAAFLVVEVASIVGFMAANGGKAMGFVW